MKPIKHTSALNVMDGIPQPESINHDMVSKMKSKHHASHDPSYYVDGIREGNRTILSQAITIIESSLPIHQEKAQKIIAECLTSQVSSVKAQVSNYKASSQQLEARSQKQEASNQQPNASLRIGITGVPGVGKSTFIEALGKYLTGQGHKLAVLAIDPSSAKTKGSILGDKTRMEELANDPNAFIRPSPSAGSLGGVARKTRETIILCEAAGFDVIFIETVGVGQSETAVHSMVDFFLLLMLAGAGDELQGIKRGIIEMADSIFINKADGDNVAKATLAKAEYRNALHLFPPSESGWVPQVGLCSAMTKSGIPEVWQTILAYAEHTRQNGYFQKKRMEQDRQIFFETIEDALKQNFYQRKEIGHTIHLLEQAIGEGSISPYMAAKELLALYFENLRP